MLLSTGIPGCAATVSYREGPTAAVLRHTKCGEILVDMSNCSSYKMSMFRHTRISQAFDSEEVLELEGAALNAAIAHRLGLQEARDFSTNLSSVMSLALPTPTDCYEDWIHTELGPRGRWIVRLLRFYRAERAQPWKSKELYLADRDEQSVPMATAYGRAWLFSWATWPDGQSIHEYRLAS